MGLTLGSLFDGSGGFPLAAQKHGIAPIWASEIEPFPIRVTRKHFPNMKHLGDIRNINGADIEPVDIIAGGSPCQNFSTAASAQGERNGLDGKSGLFHEMIRVIREMRKATKGKSPKYVIWENVTGALTCHKGGDFYTILDQFLRTGGERNSAIRPKKWLRAGTAVGNGFNLAWRTFDSAFWGVPATRRRVYLVGCYKNPGGGYKQYTKSAQILFDAGNGKADCPKPSQEAPHLSAESHGVHGEAGEPIAPTYTIDRASFHTQTRPERAYTLNASDHRDPQIVCAPTDDEGTEYEARRLTEKEYAVLQGFPEDYCNDLAQEAVTDAELTFWRGVWDEWCTCIGITRKSDKWLVKWLTTQPNKSAEYKLFGNGVALPIPEYIFEKIREVELDY